MARPSYHFIGELSPDRVREISMFAGIAKDQYRVNFEPVRATRSQQQNKYFHGVIAKMFADFLRDQDYEDCTLGAAKEYLKAKFLLVELVNPETGEIVGRRVRGTSELNVEEMTDFIERCRAWLADFFGIVVPDPDPTWFLTSSGGRAGRARRGIPGAPFRALPSATAERAGA